MKKHYVWLSLMLVLLMPLYFARGEGTEFSLKDISYTVDSVYFDGQVAEVRVLQTALQPDTALVDALSFEPGGEYSPMKDAYTIAEHVIGSYCEMSCSTADGEYENILYSLGHGFAAGKVMDATFYWWMPYGAEAEEVNVQVTVGSSSQETGHYEEMGGFSLKLSKTAFPLLLQPMNLELDDTLIKQIIVCRTSHCLTLRVYHQPLKEANSPYFTVTAAEGETLQHMMNDKREVDGHKGLFATEYAFSLKKDERLPRALVVKHHGKSTTEIFLGLQESTINIKSH